MRAAVKEIYSERVIEVVVARFFAALRMTEMCSS